MKLFKSKWLKRVILVVVGIILAIVLYGVGQLIEPVAIASITPSDRPVQFSGSALLVASDADMVATAYADAKLDRVAGIEDTLTCIKLPLNSINPIVSTIQVSNSVMSWPQIIATSPDGQRAYVVEVRSRPADGIQELETIDEMPEGETLTVVDIANRAKPKIIEAIDIGRNPEHISISPDGKLLAVNLEDRGRELLIAKLKPDGTLGKRFYFPMPTNGQRMDNRTAIWHPSGKYLAMTQDLNKRVGFYVIKTASNGDIKVEPFREPLKVGNHLSHPRFTADGSFLLVSDLKWSTKSNRVLNFLLNPRGEMIAIRFDPESEQTPQITSKAEVGLSPEGFALSPDNTLIATVNMRRTYLSANFPPFWRGKPYSSLSLVKFEPQSGKLTTIDEYGFEGLLPEQATFDNGGESLAVVIFQDREPSPKTGAVEFWHVVSGENPALERTGFKIDVVRGSHDIVLVP